MKKAFTVGLAGAALAVTLSLVAAGSFKREPAARAAAPVARKTIERAYAPDIVYASTYTGVAHIIHVPQRGERDHASLTDDDEPELTGRDYQRSVQRLPRRTVPRWSFHADAPPPPPPVTRSAVLSAPPPLAEGPTPIRPLPHLGSKIDQADKFDAPDHAAAQPAENIPPAEPPPGG
jgi:hypothetical protein